MKGLQLSRYQHPRELDIKPHHQLEVKPLLQAGPKMKGLQLSQYQHPRELDINPHHKLEVKRLLLACPKMTPTLPVSALEDHFL